MLDGWTRAQLGNLGTFHKGKGITKSDLSDHGVPCLRYAEIYTTFGDVTSRLKSFVPIGSASEATSIKYGDIIFAASGETAEDIGKAIAFVGRFDAVAGGDTVILRDHGQDPSFLAHVLNSHSVVRQKSRLGKGQSIVHIHASDLAGVTVDLPPLPEQRKIAEILRTWDEAIEKLEALRSVKEKLYSALADGLIFGTIGNDGCAWKLRRLGEVTRELTQRNNDGKLGRELVMGVTNSRGIVPMREQTIGSNLTRYKILPPKAFAYNPMRINVGSIAMLRLPSAVLVSPDYVLFECIPGKLDPDYLDHLRQSHFWGHYINAGGSGSVRMRTYYDDLAALKMKLPDFEDQQKISAILNTAQAEIGLLVSEIETLTRQKRGLMQKLLTGEWRVQVEEAA